MLQKIQFVKTLKEKQNIISWWLVLPAVLVCAQLAVLILSSGSAATYSTASANSIPDGPAVLGASTGTRGNSAVIPAAVVPQLTASDLAKVSAKSFLVYDATSNNTVLSERQPDLKIPIASLTKLMTGLLAYQNLNFTQSVTINKAGLTNIRPIVNFADKDQVTVSDIFNAMIVGSCNDAAQVLGRAVENATGQDIVKLMNQQAVALGMVNTSYANPIGFDSASNYSTANDLVKLIDATQQFAVFTNLGKTLGLDFMGSSGFNYHVVTTNNLIKTHSDILAVKTGFTEGAQGAMVTKVMKNGHGIIIIVLGSNDREQDTITLKKLLVDPLTWQ